MAKKCKICDTDTDTACPVCHEKDNIWACCNKCNTTVAFKKHLKSHAEKTKAYVKKKKQERKQKKSKVIEAPKHKLDLNKAPEPKKIKVISISSESESAEEEKPGYNPASSGEGEVGEGSFSYSEEPGYYPVDPEYSPSSPGYYPSPKYSEEEKPKKKKKSSSSEWVPQSPNLPHWAAEFLVKPPMAGSSESEEEQQAKDVLESLSEEEKQKKKKSKFSGPNPDPNPLAFYPQAPKLIPPPPGMKKWGPNPNPNPPVFYPPVVKPPVIIPLPDIQPEQEEEMESSEEEDEGVPQEVVEPVGDPEHRASYKNKPTYKTEESHQWHYREIMNLSSRWNGKLETAYQYLVASDQFGNLMERGLSFGPKTWLKFFGDFPIAAGMFLLRRAMPRFILTLKGERKHPLVLNAALNEFDQELFQNIADLPEFTFPVQKNGKMRNLLHVFYASPNADQKWEVADITMWKLIAHDLSQRRTRSLIRRHRTLISNFFYFNSISFYGNIIENEEIKRVFFGNLFKDMAKFAYENVLKNLYAVSLGASKVDFQPLTSCFEYSNGWVQPLFEQPIPELDYHALTPFVKTVQE